MDLNILSKIKIFLPTECVCNILGTNSSQGTCHHETGQCSCYPNVLGIECDQCEVNHWKIASGEGCEHCACDTVGSYEEQCNDVSFGLDILFDLHLTSV